MKMTAELPASPNAILRHSSQGVVIGERTHRESLIVPWEGPLQSWPVSAASALRADDFEGLARSGAEVVLVGTGSQHAWVHPRLLQSLMAQRIGVECMDTATACRTFNVLLQEGRRVCAALIFENP